MIQRRCTIQALLLLSALFASAQPARGNPADDPAFKQAKARYEQADRRASDLFKALQKAQKEQVEALKLRQAYYDAIMLRVPFDKIQELEEAKQHRDEIIPKALREYRRENADFDQALSSLYAARKNMARLKSAKDPNQEQLVELTVQMMGLSKAVADFEAAGIEQDTDAKAAVQRLRKAEAAVAAERTKLLKQAKTSEYEKRVQALAQRVTTLHTQHRAAQRQRTDAKQAMESAYAKAVAAGRK